MPCRATQDGRVTVESSDKTWSTGEGNGNDSGRQKRVDLTYILWIESVRLIDGLDIGNQGDC